MAKIKQSYALPDSDSAKIAVNAQLLHWSYQSVLWCTGQAINNFIEEFTDFLAFLNRILFVGDFYIHVCCPSTPFARYFPECNLVLLGTLWPASFVPRFFYRFFSELSGLLTR